MDFSLSDEQKMLVATVRRFIAEELAPLETPMEETGQLAREQALAIHQKGKALGLYALNMPEALGGGGLLRRRVRRDRRSVLAGGQGPGHLLLHRTPR